MAKRTVREAENIAAIEESEFKIGAVALYYDKGWRAGTIDGLEVNDDGDLLVSLQPAGNDKARKVKHKTKDLKLV